MGKERRFVNPYNFVPLGEKPPERKPPESHEYFIGNRGRIVCHIIFKSPFFIPHSEKRFRLPKGKNASQVQDDELPNWVRGCEKAKNAWEFLKQINASEGHEMLALLCDKEGKPFIPGSSLKGAFRAVAEALSNSCLSQLEFEWELKQKPKDLQVRYLKAKRYYSYRITLSPSGVGCVTKLPEGPSADGEIKVAQKARVFFREPMGVQNFDPEFIQDLSNYKDGQKARCNLQEFHYHRRKIPPFQAARLVREGGIEGILKITEVTDIKKSQRFIYWQGEARTVKFGWQDKLAYDRANLNSINEDRNADDYIVCRDPTKGTQIPEAGMRSKRHELNIGDIVYFSEQNGRVIDMGPVELYRRLYRYSLDEVLLLKHKDFLPCQDPNCLCPCCRLFGWVPPEGSDAAEKKTALKGFLHFSTARWIGGNPKTKWVTLQPLGQPHPSCWQFYLNCQNAGQDAGYNDAKSTIRGRKFYWHKPQVKAEKPQGGADVNSVWDQRRGNGEPIADDQNKTVELLLPKNDEGKDAVFEFTVDFENLSDADLGLLLLTLQPNLIGEQVLNQLGFSTELYHHFGMGKPLGLGSAKVKICSLTIYDSAKRYQNLMEDGVQTWQSDGVCEVARKYILAFLREALKGQDKPTHDENDEEACKKFCELPHIKALLIMLDWQKAQNLPIQYPPGGDERTGKSDPNMKEYWEAFRWFAHKNQRDFYRKPRHMLSKPNDIIKGEEHWQFGFPPIDLSQSGSYQQRNLPPTQQPRHRR